VYPAEVLDEICGGAHELGLKVHLDASREDCERALTALAEVARAATNA